MSVQILVGTRKGLFFVTGDESRRSWEVSDPELTGWEIMHAVQDPRDGAIYACTTNWVYGSTVHKSTDRGKTWERSTPLGPFLVTPDEVDDARDLRVCCDVDGRVMQDARTRDLLFQPTEIVEYLSTMFKRQTGTSPMEYRRRFREGH